MAMGASEAPMGSLKRDLEVRQFRVFLAVADTGGVAASSRRRQTSNFKLL